MLLNTSCWKPQEGRIALVLKSCLKVSQRHLVGHCESRILEQATGLLLTEDPNKLRMSAKVSLGPLFSKPRLRVREGSLVERLLSVVSCLQFCGFLMSILACILCIATTASVNWRVWRGENGSGNIWIGIWNVCFWRNPSDDGNSFWHCEGLTERYPTLPREIFIAQDLMALASTMSSAALVLISFALCNVFEPGKHEDFLLTFFRLGAFLNIPAGILILISVIWNMSSVLQNGKIDFPETFELPPISSEQHIGPSIYLGYIAAGLQLLSAALLGMERFCIRTTTTDPYRIDIAVEISPRNSVKRKRLTTCSNCGSLLDLIIKEKSSTVEIQESQAEDLDTRNESCIIEIPESQEEDLDTRNQSCIVEIPESQEEDLDTRNQSCIVEIPESQEEDLDHRNQSCIVEILESQEEASSSSGYLSCVYS